MKRKASVTNMAQYDTDSAADELERFLKSRENGDLFATISPAAAKVALNAIRQHDSDVTFHIDREKGCVESLNAVGVTAFDMILIATAAVTATAEATGESVLKVTEILIAMLAGNDDAVVRLMEGGE